MALNSHPPFRARHLADPLPTPPGRFGIPIDLRLNVAGGPKSGFKERNTPPNSAGSADLRRSRRVRFQTNPIIHRVAETLFAAQVSLCRLHGDMSKQELNLLQFTPGLMAKASASPAKVVRCKRLDLTVLRFLFHDTPNDFGAESRAPNPASFVDRTKECPRCNPGGRHPIVNSRFHPIGNRNSSYVTSLANKVGYDPVLLPLLYVFNA